LNCHDEYLAALEGETIRGILPVMRDESASGFIYNSLPCLGNLGSVIASDEEAYQMAKTDKIKLGCDFIKCAGLQVYII